VITSRAELLALLRSRRVQAILMTGGTAEDLADALLTARGELADPPVGERWDAVESTYALIGIRPIGHVGRSPTFSLETHEYILLRLQAAEGVLAEAPR